MKKVTKKVTAPLPKARDLGVVAMWGNARGGAFRDKRKVLARKAKHKEVYSW